MAWVRIDDGFAQHAKVAGAGPLAMAMQVAGLCYCNRNLTDGFIPWSIAQSLLCWDFLEPADGQGHRKRMSIGITSGMAGDDVRNSYVINLLVAVGMWEQADGGYRIHDYEDYQPTREQIMAEKAQKQAAGQAGGQATAKARALAKSKPVPDPVPDPVEERS